VALVVDASALVAAIRSPAPAAADLRRRLVEDTSHAPHLVDAEVGNVLRRHVLAGELPAADARILLSAGAALVDLRYATSDALRGAAWELRHTLTFYDALYVALASALELSLLTADARLARSPGLPCSVELVALA